MEYISSKTRRVGVGGGWNKRSSRILPTPLGIAHDIVSQAKQIFISWWYTTGAGSIHLGSMNFTILAKPTTRTSQSALQLLNSVCSKNISTKRRH